MANKDKILHSTKEYKLIERDGLIGIKSTVMNIIVMPFTCDSDKLPLSIGIVNNTNPFRGEGKEISLLSGIAEGEDPDLLSSAKRTLLEGSGINVKDTNKWYYLGISTASKFVDSEYPCFAVDITDFENEIDPEKNFSFIPANDAVKTKDIFIPGLFLKLFKYVMGMNITNPSQKSSMEKDNRNNISI